MNAPGAIRPEDLPRLFAERARSRDLDGLMDLYEPDATLVRPDGTPSCGAAEIREQLEGLLSMTPLIEAGQSAKLTAGDVAVMSSRWRITFELGEGGQRTGFEATSTEVARRQGDGSWRYVVDDPSSASLRTEALAERDGGSPSDPRHATSSTRAGSEPQRFQELIYEQDGPVARITLNRPERRNALSMRLSDELTAALELVRDSTSVKVLVIAGAGHTFCSGDDIAEMGLWGDANEIVRRVRSYQRMADTLQDLDKVTIAAVDGHAVGGGLEITMACDFAIATRRAKWGMPEVDVGITPGWGGTTRMARLIGRRITKEVNLLGALHPASRAAQLGLWNRVVDDEHLEDEVQALIKVLLSKSHQAVRQLKFIIDNGVEADLHTAQGFEALSAGLTGALNGAWQVGDADQAAGVVGFVTNGERWQTRRALAKDLWVDGPDPGAG